MSEILWTANEIVQATQGTLVGDTNWKATGLAMDSRSVKEGDIFIAMIGEEGGLDGHDYTQNAIDNGAVALIVMRELPINHPQIIVKDTSQALYDMGQYAKQRAQLDTTIAVTGSAGKTGTREMLKAAYIGVGDNTHASIKSYNNHVGVPYTLSTMPASSEVGIFEMGMNHPDEITPLSKQVAPDIAIITNVFGVHIENFDNGIDGIIQAKSEIFDGLTTEGIAILPSDSDHYATLLANAKTAGIQNIYSFGEREDSDAQLLDCILAANGTRVTASIMGEEVSYTLQIAGKHIAINSLSALLAIKLSGRDVQKAAKALASIEPIEGRGKRETINSGDPDNPITLIDEAYNANPESMKAAFKVLAMIDPGRGGRRIAVLGDMLEMGSYATQGHEELAMPLQAAGVDLLYCCGQHMKKLYDKMPVANQGAHTKNSAELAEIVPDALTPGDVVLVKGSNGSKLKTVVEAMRAMT